MPNLNSITYDTTQFNIQSGGGGLIHLQSVPFKWNSSKSKFAIDTSKLSSYAYKIIDGGFDIEDNNSTSETQIKFRVSLDTTRFKLNAGDAYHVRCQLLQANNGSTKQVGVSPIEQSQNASDRINNFLFKISSGVYRFTITLDGLTSESTWENVVLLVEIYGNAPTAVT